MSTQSEGFGIFHLPLFPGFRKRILPVLVLYWAIAAALTTEGYPIALAVGAWATVTTIMLWPVASEKKYLSYRTGWFVLAVASMVGILIFSYLIINSTTAEVKYASLIALAVNIGFWGIIASFRSSFSKPLPMLFRPDLLFGDGRLLAGGIVAIGLGVKFIFSNAPPGDVPVGNWYALFSVILLGLLPIIPLRGMWKMRNRITRVFFGRLASFWVAAAKETFLLVAIVLLMFSFHNFFGGVVPFTKDVLKGSSGGLAIMLASALGLILLRSWYKLKIGDPFIKESFGQSLIKNSILAIGLIFFIYGFINVMVGGFPRLPNSGDYSYLTLIGSALMAWGLILLIPVRSWAQSNQRFAMMRQMIEVVLPRTDDKHRGIAVGKVVDAVAGLGERQRLMIVAELMRFLNEMNAKDRDAVMKAQMQALTALPTSKRLAMMKAIDRAATMQ